MFDCEDNVVARRYTPFIEPHAETLFPQTLRKLRDAFRVFLAVTQKDVELKLLGHASSLKIMIDECNRESSSRIFSTIKLFKLAKCCRSVIVKLIRNCF